MHNKQRVICLDLEGTLAEELWLHIANKTGIAELSITTRDIPDTHHLARMRVKTVNDHNLRYSDIIALTHDAKILDGAREFLLKLRLKIPRILIATDLAEELAGVYLKQLDHPNFFGQSYEIKNDRLVRFHFRQENHKKALVLALQSLNFEVYAAGDSYNDVPMLETADKGYFIHAPQKIREDFSEFESATHYDELLDWLTH